MQNQAPTRIAATRRNLNNYPVKRFGGIISAPTVFRHTLHSAAVPAVVYWRIHAEGLRVSSAGVSGQWGEGAYVWSVDAEVGDQPYVDVEVPPGTLVEELWVKDQRPFYRLLPHGGQHIRVRVVGTNLPETVLEQVKTLLS